jgi:NADPH:quinone reductase-like Zn-dependent oxidoreductase
MLECAGVVTEVGAEVAGVEVGDDVIVYPVTGAYADYVTAPVRASFIDSGWRPLPAVGRPRPPRGVIQGRVIV